MNTHTALLAGKRIYRSSRYPLGRRIQFQDLQAIRTYRVRRRCSSSSETLCWVPSGHFLFRQIKLPAMQPDQREGNANAGPTIQSCTPDIRPLSKAYRQPLKRIN